MQVLKNILDESERSFERGDYAHARDLLAKAAFCKKPTREVLSNLVLAEQLQRFCLLKQLICMHKESVECHLQYIKSLVDLGKADMSVQHCTQLISDYSNDERLAVRLCLVRFDLAIRSHCYTFLRDDFHFVWEAGDRLFPARHFRRALVQGIVSINDCRALEAVNRLIHLYSNHSELTTLLQHKIKELEYLNIILSSMKNLTPRIADP